MLAGRVTQYSHPLFRYGADNSDGHQKEKKKIKNKIVHARDPRRLWVLFAVTPKFLSFFVVCVGKETLSRNLTILMDVCIQDNYNTFHLAVLYSREDVIKNLLARKADITILAGVNNQKDLHK